MTHFLAAVQCLRDLPLAGPLPRADRLPGDFRDPLLDGLRVRLGRLEGVVGRLLERAAVQRPRSAPCNDRLQKCTNMLSGRGTSDGSSPASFACLIPR